jgi:polo-like kinase 1
MLPMDIVLKSTSGLSVLLCELNFAHPLGLARLIVRYTMLVGRPPFQTKDVKAIYKRIKENRYEFPTDKPISLAAENLITAILNPNPGTSPSILRNPKADNVDERPSVETILHHPFFTNGAFPDRIPLSAHDAEPSFRHISDSASRQNFKQACKNARVGVAISAFLDQTTKRTALGPSIVKQEQDFQNAVQPGSPISALLQYVLLPVCGSSLIM